MLDQFEGLPGFRANLALMYKELDQLDDAPGLEVKSRLGCQCVPDGTRDLVVEIPEWNKNFAKEAEH